MSNDVVITKELRDALVKWFEQYGEIMGHEPSGRFPGLVELRAAPEAVGLEGVEEQAFYQSIGDSLEDALIENIDHIEGAFTMSELANIQVEQIKPIIRCLVAPVQPSAVVSREAIYAIVESTGGPIYGSIAKLTDAIYALQLPQPVAPVQSGGVDELRIAQQVVATLKNLEGEKSWHGYTASAIARDLAHLTTTQIATSVPSDYVSVPVGLVKDLTIVCSKAEDDDAYAMEKALEKILAERMGTKL